MLEEHNDNVDVKNQASIALPSIVRSAFTCTANCPLLAFRFVGDLIPVWQSLYTSWPGSAAIQLRSSQKLSCFAFARQISLLVALPRRLLFILAHCCRVVSTLDSLLLPYRVSRYFLLYATQDDNSIKCSRDASCSKQLH